MATEKPKQKKYKRALYAAQRIEELELISDVQYKCLRIAMEALEWCASNAMECVADEAMIQIRRHLVELEPEESTQ